MEWRAGRGIVLKGCLPAKRSAVLLDAQHGKIVAVVHSGIEVTRLCSGMLLAYGVQSREHVTFLHNVDLIAWPHPWACGQLHFLHHVLELCFHFSPIASPAHRLFSSLIGIYCTYDEVVYPLVRWVTLLRIFVCLGMYPRVETKQESRLQRLVETPIDMLLGVSIDLEEEKLIKRWLRACVVQYPDLMLLKTRAWLTTVLE